MLSYKAVLSIVGAVVVFIDVGSLYTFGAMAPYITSYLSYQKNIDVQIINISVINPLTLMMMPVGMIVGSTLATKVDIRIVICSSFLLYGLMLLALSFTNTVAACILLYGIGLGFFQGLPYMLPMNNAYKYFPKKKGLISGICMAGLGFGALIFNELILHLLNPDNQKYDQHHHFPKDVADRLPFALKILGAVYFGISVLGAALIVPFKKDIEQSNTIEPQNQSQQVLIDDSNDCPDLKTALKSTLFYKLLFCIVLSSAFGIYVAFNYKQYGMSVINDDAFLTLSGSMGAIANGASRFIWGVLYDIIPFKILITVADSILLACAISFPFVVSIKACFMLYIMVIYFAYGGLYSIFPSITYKIFGQLHGARIYSLLFFGFGLGSLFQFIVHYAMTKHYDQKGSQYAFWVLGSFQILGILLITITKWEANFKLSSKVSSEIQS